MEPIIGVIRIHYTYMTVSLPASILPVEVFLQFACILC